MALTKQFSGNLFDKDGVEISDIICTGYHKETNTWSTVYDTGSEVQYNMNLGDAGWLTQTGVTNVGDTILLKFETKEADPLDRQFALYEFTLTSSDTYIQNIQLEVCQPPNVVGLWSLSSGVDGTNTFVDEDSGYTVSIGRINDLVSTSTNFNDDYSWSYDGVTLKHMEVCHGQDIFSDRLSVDSIKFDFTDSGTFTEPDTHTYTTISPANPGYTEIDVEAINQKGQVVTDTLYIQIRYNTPIADIIWSPEVPNVNDTLTITGNNTDVDGTVVAISYKFDNVEIANNTNLSYQWIQSLGSTYQTSYPVHSNVTWNDGFDNHTIVHLETLIMENLAPTFTLDTEVIGAVDDNHIKFSPLNITDPDGDDASVGVKWKIEFKTPFDNQYKTVMESDYPAQINQDPKEYIFTQAGDYRVTATIKDSFGLETSEDSVVNFNSSTTCTGSGTIRLNNNNWQLIAIPVENKTVGNYFIPKVADAIKTYDVDKDASDVIEVCSAYPGHINKFLSYIPGFTLDSSEHNFNLTMVDGVDIKEVTGFWIKVKNYYSITDDVDILIDWDQRD